MTDKNLRKLKRSELLELMLEQSREIDRLQEELEETRAALQERNLKIESCGSIAEAAAEVNSLFYAAQRAADMYLLNVQRICAEQAEQAGAAEKWQETLRVLDPAGMVPVPQNREEEQDPDQAAEEEKEGENSEQGDA
ncbi:MAG: hypothetical protein Q4D15_09595 [Lachnospiraceae bacterium]|nr:hypothetical protein [Lachnospiraceae bacterium]